MDTVKGWYQTWCDFPQPKKIKIIKGAAFACFSLFLLFVVIYGFGGTGKKTKTLTPTVIFMEAMPSSFQTLRYLAQRRDVSVAMVVLTVSGWVPNLDAAYDNLAAFLQLLRKEGYTKSFDVYYGNSVAMADDAFFSKLEYIAGVAIPASTTSCSYRRVFDEVLSTSAERLFTGSSLLDLVDVTDPQARLKFYDTPLYDYLGGKSANFLVLGPATDAAAFLKKYPARRTRVQSIVMAGGAFLGQGDAQYLYPDNHYAEVNFFLDPSAANYVAQGSHGRPVTLVTLDAAEPWNADAYNQLVSSRSSTSATTEDQVTSAGVVGASLSGYYSQVGSSSKPVAVSLFAASLLADNYLQNGAEVSTIPVSVLTGGGLDKDGRSIRPASGSTTARVVTGIDMKAFYAHLLRVDALSFA